MAKTRTVFVCSSCGYETSRWIGKCPSCMTWGTLTEQLATPAPPKAAAPIRLNTALPSTLAQIESDAFDRITTGEEEFDRVLGGGVVPGSLLLISGDPGIGKSTLLLQVAAHLSQGHRVLYISGEESARQIKMRADRLGLSGETLHIMSETQLETILGAVEALGPDFLVIDSIQTMYRQDLTSAPGSVAQVRECTAHLMRQAKGSGTSIFLVGHVTKDGSIAGPRVLEHMVDAVLYFEGDRQHQFRILRAAKNRFGSVNELGIFQMQENGMAGVCNPSELLLSQRAQDAPGSCVIPSLEGTRPMLVDLQALVAPSFLSMPRRTTSGIDPNRLALLLAVLDRRAGFSCAQQDVYVNVAGGLSLDEPAADLAVCAAIASSLKNIALPPRCAVVGEVGLAGEVRAIRHLERRLSECARLGFELCVVPKANLKDTRIPDGLTVKGVDSLRVALKVLMP